MPRSVVPKGKSRGTYIGRLYRVRASGAFTIQTKSGLVGKSHKYCQVIQHADGNYNKRLEISLVLDGVFVPRFTFMGRQAWLR